MKRTMTRSLHSALKEIAYNAAYGYGIMGYWSYISYVVFVFFFVLFFGGRTNIFLYKKDHVELCCIAYPETVQCFIRAFDWKS